MIVGWPCNLLLYYYEKQKGNLVHELLPIRRVRCTQPYSRKGEVLSTIWTHELQVVTEKSYRCTKACRLAFVLLYPFQLILYALPYFAHLNNCYISLEQLGDFPMDCPLHDSLLRIHYKGMLLNEENMVFYDSKVDNNDQPLEFSSGEGLVSYHSSSPLLKIFMLNLFLASNWPYSNYKQIDFWICQTFKVVFLLFYYYFFV